MQIIYEPKGAALEYAPLACNLYTTCPHGCQYCYCPGILRMKTEDFFQPAKAKTNAIERLIHDCTLLHARNDERTIFLSFVGDVYAREFATPEDNITRKALGVLAATGRDVKILTKNPGAAIDDFDIIRRNNWTLGATFDGHNYLSILKYLRIAKRYIIKTWVSMEPIINIKECKEAIVCYENDIDFWSFGRLSGKKDGYCADDFRAFKKFVNSILPVEKVQWKKSLREF
jgi:hypothetical protein